MQRFNLFFFSRYPRDRFQFEILRSCSTASLIADNRSATYMLFDETMFLVKYNKFCGKLKNEKYKRKFENFIHLPATIIYYLCKSHVCIVMCDYYLDKILFHMMCQKHFSFFFFFGFSNTRDEQVKNGIRVAKRRMLIRRIESFF